MSIETKDGAPIVWRKPSDVMKLRQMKLKKRNLQKRFGISDILDENEHSNRDKTSKVESVFINPFRHSPNKRQKLNDDDPRTLNENAFDVTLLQRLQETDKKPNDFRVTSNLCLGDLIAQTESETEDSVIGDKEENVCETYLPVDWSLKAGIRLTSNQPFPWSGRLTTPEEASGVTSFTRCLPLYGGGLFSCKLDTSPNAQLFQCCQIWMHPFFPWLNLYPRLKVKKSTANPTSPIPSQLHKSIHSDWCQSFRSLFHLLRARQCPYFYLCANNFTVLFRASGISSNPQVHAFITPTTKGLRSAFSDEGIEYTMPLAESNASQSSSNENTELEEEEEELEKETDAWLKSVGVDGDVMARLSQDTPISSKSEKNLDFHPHSLVYVKDSNAHALFNYLINSKRCTPTWGPLTGVPPTLLSPVAFTGGTLRSLQMRHRQSQQVHTLDILGPVLPHVIHCLHMLLKARAPKSDFRLTLSTLEETASFSTADEHITVEGTAPPVFSQQGLSDCGLEGEVLQNMCLPFKTGVLSEVQMERGKTAWT